MTVFGDPEVTDVRAFDPRCDLDGALRTLREGGVVVLPSETGYVMGLRLSDRALPSVLQRRVPEGEPVTVLVSGREAVLELGWSRGARELAEVFWPGAVTLLLRDPTRRFAPAARDGVVAVRVSSHPVASALVRALGEPLVALPGEGERDDARAALVGHRTRASAEGLEPAPHLLDAGALPTGERSTIVDCTGARPRLLREGFTPASRLRCVLPDLGHD